MAARGWSGFLHGNRCRQPLNKRQSVGFDIRSKVRIEGVCTRVRDSPLLGNTNKFAVVLNSRFVLGGFQLHQRGMTERGGSVVGIAEGLAGHHVTMLP